MKVSLENGELVIRIPVEPVRRLSATGKSKVVATSRGNQVTSLQIDGKPVVVGLNAYIPAH